MNYEKELKKIDQLYSKISERTMETSATAKAEIEMHEERIKYIEGVLVRLGDISGCG